VLGTRFSRQAQVSGGGDDGVQLEQGGVAAVANVTQEVVEATHGPGSEV
jgi:hypothetical protein